ncbi:hypothetical protein CT0861_13184 [Colletotrichum tofieldiae]|uniref:Uncharacterized protein n=1 Tax=Colletotrichum tofieldiae TaxID=708197 RepID=A0A166W6U1_9PEZI|nr:hypothetical protein CT0861_13184 [Colletotrichum tofieldiae]
MDVMGRPTFTLRFELGDGGLVRILQRDILPPASLNGSYCPTTGSSSPFPSENLLACLKDPSILLNGTRNVLDRVVCKKDGPLQLNDSPCVGYGLLLEEGISHRQLKISRILCVVFSYLFGLSWAASTGKILVGLVVGNCLAILSLVLIRKVLSTCLIAPSSVASLTG